MKSENIDEHCSGSSGRSCDRGDSNTTAAGAAATAAAAAAAAAAMAAVVFRATVKAARGRRGAASRQDGAALALALPVLCAERARPRRAQESHGVHGSVVAGHVGNLRVKPQSRMCS